MTVISNEATMGNYFLGNLIGNLAFNGTKDIMGMINHIVRIFPVRDLKLIKRETIFETKSFVPFHEPLDWLIFLINVTGISTFNISLCDKRQEQVIDC